MKKCKYCNKCCGKLCNARFVARNATGMTCFTYMTALEWYYISTKCIYKGVMTRKVDRTSLESDMYQICTVNSTLIKGMLIHL